MTENDQNPVVMTAFQLSLPLFATVQNVGCIGLDTGENYENATHRLRNSLVLVFDGSSSIGEKSFYRCKKSLD